MSYYQDHVITLYNKWKEDPKTVEQELTILIDKFIYSELRGKNFPVNKRFEDNEDLLQDLRTECLIAWNKVTEPTNKRITNYLKATIQGAIKDKFKDIAKDNKRVESERLMCLSKTSSSMEEEFELVSPQLKSVLNLRLDGYTKKEISEKLSISPIEVTKRLERLENIYEEEYI